MNTATLAHLGKFAIGLDLVPAPPGLVEPPPKLLPDPIIKQQRIEIFRNSLAGSIYAGPVILLFEEMVGIPGAFLDDLEINRQIAFENELQDGFYAATYFLSEAYRRLPNLPRFAAAKAAAESVRENFTPNLEVIKLSFAKQVDFSRALQPKLDTHRADLEALPVVGGTALDWMREGIDASVRLDARLDQRDINRAAGSNDRTRLITLRTDLIRELMRLRTALADEARGNRIPKNAEALLFGPLDELIARS